MNEDDINLASIDGSLGFYPMLKLKVEIKRKNDKNKNLKHLKESVLVKWSKTQRQQPEDSNTEKKKLRKLGKPFSLQIFTHEQERRSRLFKHHRRKWKQRGTRNKKETKLIFFEIFSMKINTPLQVWTNFWSTSSTPIEVPTKTLLRASKIVDDVFYLFVSYTWINRSHWVPKRDCMMNNPSIP